MKVGMLISDRYRKWFTTEEVCQFPKLKMWQWLEVKQPPEKWVGVKCAGEGLEYLPQFIFDFDGNGKNWKVEIHNTGKEVNASAINAHYPTEKVFPYGRHKLFQGKIEFESTRTPRLPEKRSVVKLFAHSVKKEGLNRAIKRSINHLRPNFMREYFGDVMGVFDGYYAFKGPGFVQIDVTNRCNNNCIGCWCNSPLLGSRRMNEDTKKFTLPLSLVKELIDELASTGTKEIYYSGGGEPFMHPDMFSILEYTKRRNLICHINTNFTLLDKKNVERLINIPVDYITVSLWAGTPSTYTKIHPNKDEETFHEILRCLKVLNSKKAHLPFVKLYQVICNLNYTEIPQMIELAKETHSESVEFTMIDTVPGATDVLLLSKNEQRQLLRICQEVLNRRQEEGWMKDVVLFKFDNFLNRIRDSKDVTEGFYDRWIIGKIPCYIGWCSSRILANGDVNGCLKAHRIPVGNIYKKHFNEIWNSPQMLDFRHRTLTFDKNDPFFSLIGNDPNSKVGCYKSCDDIGRNVIMHERIKSLSVLEKCYLKILSRKERKRY
ncbi:MAG TPA: radical SAM protein, partial [Candidatus Omnitrophica bacterium]|nr:radical SAM protein [Candidatus Omnitrophota bacterium]